MLWALRVLPSHLFNRQLWHLAVADIGLSAVYPLFQTMLATTWRGKQVSRMSARSFRMALHFWLFVVCLVEMQIAAGVATCAWHSPKGLGWLARALPFTWLLASGCAGLDMWLMDLDVAAAAGGQYDIAGGAPVVAVVVGICFLGSVLLHAAAVVGVVRKPTPNAVIRRASMRALVFPCNFLITIFPAWIHYVTNDEFSVYWWLQLSGILMYSNGLVNAAVYGLQNRRICRCPCGAAVDSAGGNRLGGPFIVAFGGESHLSAPNGSTMTSTRASAASGVAPHGTLADPDHELWGAFIGDLQVWWANQEATPSYMDSDQQVDC